MRPDDLAQQEPAATPAEGLDVERLAKAMHECLPACAEDDEAKWRASGWEPFCEYLAHAVAARYCDPDWRAGS